MGLMDTVKAQANAGLAKATEASKAGQAKLDAVQAKRNADTLLRRLGSIAFADHRGRTTASETSTEVERIVAELESYETEYGPLAP